MNISCILLMMLNSVSVLEIEPVDFGVVQSGEIVCSTAEVTNNSEHEVKINEVFTSCSCFSVSFSPVTLRFRDTLSVPLVINTSGRVGETTQTISIVTDSETYHTTAHGVVREDVRSMPSSLTLKYPNHLEQRKKFYLWSSYEKFSIIGIDYNKEILDVVHTKELPKYYHEQGKYIHSAFTFSVKFADHYKQNNFEEPVQSIITVKTDSLKRPEVQVKVILLPRTKSIVTFSPSSWILNKKNNKKPSFQIHLQGENVNFLDITCTIDSIEITALADAHNKNLIKVDLSQKSHSDKNVESGHVAVKTNHGISKIPLLVFNK